MVTGKVTTLDEGIISDINQPKDGIISLREVVDGITAPKIEHLFSPALRDSDIWTDQKLRGALRELSGGRRNLDKESEDNLSILFQMLNEALEQELTRT